LLKFKCFNRNSKGMTLVEVLIAMAIGVYICAAAIGILNQVLVLPPRMENDMLAMRQVQNIGYSMSQDGVQAQTVTATAPSGFPLVISFVQWPVNGGISTTTNITYSLITGNGVQRQIVIYNEKTGAVISQSQRTVADHITSITAQYAIVNNKKLLTISITAQFSTAIESRTYQISLRSG
jgi:prepilin-type N-terminal cleavage/methylation domain-containing protein